ncbi:zinc finger 226-like [Solea senegalensis]|uniref:Zinc finger 226-like n=1 Tax=Solea senegalensis TaxID=28829 RepID=A0AAV6T5R9_SOLSE|nr:zinc finger protein 189-like [Solea senegalensis]KAG7524803.1 zinc finger 226-like [Solea senegalensis]
MSADVSSLHAQVESVLGALVKAATVELTRLFESRYRTAAVDAAHAEIKLEHGAEETLNVSPAESKRSVGVQVDASICSLLDISGPLFLDGCVEEEEQKEECPIPAELLLAEDNGHADPWRSLLKEEVSAEPVDLLALDILEMETRADGDAQIQVILQDTSTLSSPTKHTPLIIVADSSDAVPGEIVKFVCPLILKPESPAPKSDSLKKPVEAEPQQACVSTAKGTAYSPSPSDGAMTRIHAQKEMNSLHMKLKLTSQDQKLLSQCAVELVNVLSMPASEMRPQSDSVKHKTSYRLPKDLRHHHQGLHTGHRICCFTPCENDVWRLRKVVAHSRDGYVCSVCKKTFKHRKILRRHERFHTGEKPYQCPQCPKTFALRKSHRRHARFHSGERPHICTMCDKSFRLRENLKAHLRFHSGEKPFSCAKCGKLFRIKRNLEKHNLSQCGFFVPSFKMIAGM